MAGQAIKTKTTKGAKIAPYTLVVEFKPEFQRCNHATGEIIQFWTYRSDKENQDFEAEKGISFEREIDVLGFLYAKFESRFKSAKLYANYKPAAQQLQMEAINGKVCFPVEPERKAKFKAWINSTL